MESSIDKAAHEATVSPHTVSAIFQSLRDACEVWYNLNCSEKIGGVNTIVEVDETVMSKRKNYAGRVIPPVWIFGGCCRETKEVFAVKIPNRSKQVLHDEIKNHIKPGTTINSDMWKGYNGIENLGYTHNSVNHSLNFVNPDDGTHTQNIERVWRGIKDRKRQFCGIPESEIESHLYTYLWRKKRSITPSNAFEETLHMISDVEWT